MDREKDYENFDLTSEVSVICVLLFLGLVWLPFSRTMAMIVCIGGLVCYGIWMVYRSTTAGKLSGGV